MATNPDDLDEHIEDLLASEPLIDDLLCLAQASAATSRLQVVTLAAAMVQAAVEGDVPEDYVRDVVEVCIAGAREEGPKIGQA
jgi:hypothetical protein